MQHANFWYSQRRFWSYKNMINWLHWTIIAHNSCDLPIESTLNCELYSLFHCACDWLNFGKQTRKTDSEIIARRNISNILTNEHKVWCCVSIFKPVFMFKTLLQCSIRLCVVCQLDCGLRSLSILCYYCSTTQYV